MGIPRGTQGRIVIRLQKRRKRKDREIQRAEGGKRWTRMRGYWPAPRRIREARLTTEGPWRAK